MFTHLLPRIVLAILASSASLTIPTQAKDNSNDTQKRDVDSQQIGALESEVLAIFEKNCAECHKAGSKKRVPLTKETNLAALRTSSKYVTAGSIEKSDLYQRVKSGIDDDKHMPDSEGMPGDPDYRPPLSPAELGVLEMWINTSPAPAARRFISDEEINLRIIADLNTLPPQLRPDKVRYLTLTNLYNQTDARGQPSVSDADLALYRSAVSKLLNSLSWSATIANPTPVDTEQTILRIYLPGYSWSTDFWDRIATFYPYAILSNSVAERQGFSLTRSTSPRLRADWFVFALSQPPLYHEALQLPGLDGSEHADTALEKQLQVQVRRNLQGGRAQRAAFELSGVSVGNRMIEHHLQSNGGGYWKSYDFDRNRKDQQGGDLFAAPLGPPGTGITGDPQLEFHQDGGEIVFTLPNGLHGYLLVNAQGQIINRGPTNIVHDASRSDGAIINGISCISCHQQGLFDPPADQLRDLITSSRTNLPTAERDLITALYDKDKLATAFKDTRNRFQAAAKEAGFATGPADEEPVRKLYNKFLVDIKLEQLASEFGQNGDFFLTDMKRSKEPRVRLLAAKLENGVAIPRGSFISSFEVITKALELGDLRSFEPPPFEEFGGTNPPPPRPKPNDTLTILREGKQVAIPITREPRKASKETPFANGLGMLFVPCVEHKGLKKVLFSIWETRSRDYATFMRAASYTMQGSDANNWKSMKYSSDNTKYPEVPVGRGKGETVEQSNHPVQSVSYEDAVAFCAWLTLTERAAGRITSKETYQLPNDQEWSYAVGIGEKEPSTGTPESKSMELQDVFPWSGDYPPAGRPDNYADSTSVDAGTNWGSGSFIKGYTDGFATTAPVGSFDANNCGLYDMGGNITEWCSDLYNTKQEHLPYRTSLILSAEELRKYNNADHTDLSTRGGNWLSYSRSDLKSAFRGRRPAEYRNVDIGFRCVLVMVGSSSP